MPECPTEFNIATNLKHCGIYKKDLQESTDPLKYIFDIKPGPMCYTPTEAFQGQQLTVGRQPPPQLLDMELALQVMPLKEEENDYIVKDIHNAKPRMPALLRNRMIVPECKTILKYRTGKLRRIDFPEYSQRVERTGYYDTNYMRPGIDTRQLMRDAFSKWEKKQFAQENIYGVGVVDKKPLTAGTSTFCQPPDVNLGCMNVYGPNATVPTTPQTTNVPIGQASTMTMGRPAFPTYSGANSRPAAESSPVAETTQQVAKTINPNVGYVNLLQPSFAQAGCNARFYNYVPPC